MTIELPEHIEKVSKNRGAIAPYNFIELPEAIAPAEQLPRYDLYDTKRYTGQIECILTTSSPLYVRCGLTAEEVKEGLEAKDQPDFFYADPQTQLPVIPGSSLRGMFRTLVEIAGFGKIERVSDRPRFFFRAVAASKDDPLAAPYKELLKNVRAGYLIRKDDGWYIQPAKTIGQNTYLKVRAKYASSSVSILDFNDPNYQPQYIPVSFTYKKTPKGRIVIDKINFPGVYRESGILVSSGNMLETNKKRKSPRKNHCVVLEPRKTTQLLKVDDQAIADYRAGLTDFQKEAPFDEKWGMLADGRPVFYCHPRQGNVIYFGQSPNFRIPYRFAGSKRAATLADFVPDTLKSPQITDLAEAIFGYVRGEKQEEEQALAGRVFVGDAKLLNGQGDDIWWRKPSQSPITPKILASPEPTTFQHYLTQDSSNKRDLNHYAKKPGQDTVIRGHKLYWHKGEVKYNDIAETDQKKIQEKETQYTQIRPVKKGTKFEFTIRFENLSEIELGALLWVLLIAVDDKYRLKLGMGKPQGMGAIKISHKVVLRDSLKRYRALFDGSKWETGHRPITEDENEKCVNAFTEHILKHLSVEETEFNQIPRIQSLLAMLSWPGPPRQKTRYMEIERDKRLGYIGRARRQDKTVNEYKDRPVLQRPLQVIDDPNSSHSKTSSEPTSTTPNLTVSLPAEEIKKEKVLNIPPVGHIFRGSVSDPETYEGVVIFQVPNFNVSEVIGALPIEESKRNQYPKGQQRWVSVTRIGKLNDGKKVLYLRLVPKAERKALKEK